MKKVIKSYAEKICSRSLISDIKIEERFVFMILNKLLIKIKLILVKKRMLLIGFIMGEE